jgi:hypothetical protein
VHTKVQLWTKQIEHLRSSTRASNFHGSTTGQHRQTSMEKRAAWLASVCVCRRETLNDELQTGQKRRQLDLARARQRIAQLKVEPWSVSRRGSHDGETPERWAAFRLPACSHRRISAPGGARVWLRAPKGDALPPSMCVCASQRLDLGGELGDGACTKHTMTSQPGERTTARHGRNDGSARYDELKAKPSASLRVHARVYKPAV